MVYPIGTQAGYYTGMSAVISRMAASIQNAVAGAMGVVTCFNIVNMQNLAKNDPEKYKELYPQQVAIAEEEAKNA